MKKGFSVELKIILTAVVMLLTLFTALIGLQIFRNNNESVTFVYNSTRAEIMNEVNISDIFFEI